MGYKYKRVSGKHTPYHRYVWEQAHLGESAAGKVVIFLDGDRTNFDLENLVCVTRRELCVMNKLGNREGLTAEERTLILIRARIAIAKSELVGEKEAAAIHRREYYKVQRRDPDFRERRAAYHKKHNAEILADPERHEAHLQKMAAFRENNRERVNEYARKYRDRHREEINARQRERRRNKAGEKA